MAEEEENNFNKVHDRLKNAVAVQNGSEIMNIIHEVQKQQTADNNLNALLQVFSGYVPFFEGDHQAAKTIWTALERLDFTSEVPALAAGESLLRINEADLALRNFIRASEINPNNALNWINISQLRQNLGEFDAAADAAAKATLAAPKNPDAHNQLGVTSIQIADHEDAIRAFENAFELSPMFGPYAANLANFYKQNLSSEDVPISANRFLANNPDVLALLCLKAEMLLRANDLEEAINTLSHAENINPRDPEVMRLQLEAMRVQQRIGRVNSQNMTPDQLAEAYDKLITNNMDEAEQLGTSYKSTIFWLSVLVPSLWTILFFVIYLINSDSFVRCLVLTCDNTQTYSTGFDWKHLFSASFVTTTSTTFLVLPLLLKGRRCLLDQRACKLGIEDYTRKQLLLNFVAVYSQRPAKNAEAIRLGLEHFNERGNAEEITLKANERRFKYSRNSEGLPSNSSMRALARKMKHLRSVLKRD